MLLIALSRPLVSFTRTFLQLPGNVSAAAAFAVAFLGDVLDVAAHVVVVTGLLHTHFQVSLVAVHCSCTCGNMYIFTPNAVVLPRRAVSDTGC
jgi:hypothetical protein